MILIVIFAILASVVNKIYTKIYIKDTDPYSMLLITNMMLAVATAPILFFNFNEVFLISSFGWAVIVFTCTLWAFNGFLGNYTYKIAPVSIREPLSQAQIIFAVIIGVLVFSESPTMYDYFGIVLILLAGLSLAFGKKVDRDEVNLHVVYSVLFMAFVAAITTALDKYTLNFVDAKIYIFFNFFISSIVLCFVMSKPRFNLIKETVLNKTSMWHMFLLSLFFGSSFYASLLAYQHYDFSIIYPILKITAPLAAVIGILFLGERNNWKIKIFAAIVAFLGVVIIKLF